MNPLELKLQELEAQIQAIREGRDIEFGEALKRFPLKGVFLTDGITPATTGDINQSISSTQSHTSPNAFDLRAKVTVEGVPGLKYIGLYNV